MILDELLKNHKWTFWHYCWKAVEWHSSKELSRSHSVMSFRDYAYNSVCSEIIYIHCANCIGTIFHNCVGHPQTLKTWCLLNLLYCDMSYIDSTTKLRQSVKASGQLRDIQKVNGKQMAVLLFKFADPVSAYTHRMRKICVKIYRDTNLSWVCIICSLVLHAEISSKGSRWKVW